MGGESQDHADYVSYSRLATYSCPARGYYAYERQLATEPNVFTAAGKAGHDALDTFYRSSGDIGAAMQQFDKTWTEQGGEAFDLSGDSLNRQHMQTVLNNYFRNHHKPAYEPIYLADMLGDGIVASEAEVVFDAPGVSMPIKMILDRVMRHKHTGQVEVWDTKFTASRLTPYSQWAPSIDEKYMLSYQIPLYTLAWRHLTGLDIQVGKVEAIYMGTAKGQNPGEVRPITIFDRWDDEMESDTLGWVQSRIEEIEWRRATGHWPQLDGAMERQYICARCSYRQLCEARPSAREGLIQLHYKERE